MISADIRFPNSIVTALFHVIIEYSYASITTNVSTEVTTSSKTCSIHDFSLLKIVTMSGQLLSKQLK